MVPHTYDSTSTSMPDHHLLDYHTDDSTYIDVTVDGGDDQIEEYPKNVKDVDYDDDHVEYEIIKYIPILNNFIIKVEPRISKRGLSPRPPPNTSRVSTR